MIELIDLKLGTRAHDPKFRKILNAALRDLGFSSEEQLGILFLIGYTACREASHELTRLLEVESADPSGLDKARDRVALYASSKKNFWGKLDPDKLHNSIYNLCYICHDVLADNKEPLDTNLRTTEGGYTLLKSSVDEDWVTQYRNDSFKLGTVTNVYYDFIRRLGGYLATEKVSKPDSYSIGLATYGYMQQFDLKGNDYIAGFVSAFYPPTFGAIARYSKLYQDYPYELSKNHIFSTIFQTCNGGIQEIVRSGIHQVHQFVFYDKESSKLRSCWDFKDTSVYEGLIMLAFSSAADIRNKYINYTEDHIRAIIKSGEVYDTDAIGADLSDEELWNLVCGVMGEKYGFRVSVHGWQCAGEFMEFIGIFFYETCLHAIVANSISFKD